MERHPSSKLHCSLEIANCLKYQKRWDEAIEAYKDTYRYGPDRVMQMQILHSIKICMDKRSSEGEVTRSSRQG
jgi:hypothetical protein